jgi:oxaloacetate decarboxylase beta subunit
MSWDNVLELIKSILTTQTGIPSLAVNQVLMMLVGLFFLYLAIAKEYEPLLLVPIGFGIFLVNFPLTPLMGFTEHGTPELIRFFYKYGVEWEVIPCVIFLGLGAMTDFGPLIANPKTLIIGAGAQLGVFITYIGTLFVGFTLKEAASVGIIGGADGPTTIYLTAKLAPHLLGANALAAYSYMAMVPLIQPPIMRLLTTPEQRKIKMRQLRPVSQREKLLFPLIGVTLIVLLIPAVAPLMGMFMFGNLMRECGVVKRLSDTAQNALMNIVTIFLGVSVGATMQADVFLNWKPLMIFAFGLADFTICTAGGILTVHIMNMFLKEKMNPLIGSAGVSAVPMSARVSHSEGLKADPDNWLIMHAMGPNLAGVIGSAAAAGMFIAMFQ